MGLFTYYVSRRRGGEGVWQMLTIADEGGGGVSRKLTIADEGGGRGGHPKADNC